MNKNYYLFAWIFLLFSSNVFGQTCLPNGITFTTQEEVDSFAIDYPGCTEVEGTLTILGSSITNLNGLNTITSIGEDLEIGHIETLTNQPIAYEGNPNLNNLSGLNNLTSIGGDLLISGNDVITDLQGLNNLTSIGSSLRIYNNQSLTNLTGLEGLTALPGSLIIGNYENNCNFAFVYFNGECEAISSGNDGLLSLDGLNNVQTVGGSVSIKENDALLNLTGLNNLESIGVSFIFHTNPAATSFIGLEKLKTINGNFFLSGTYTWCEWYQGVIVDCYDYTLGGNGLIDFTGLDSLPSIGGSLWVRENSNLESFSGAENLATVGGSVRIEYNPMLESFSGFDNLNNIGGSFELTRNNSLNDLSALMNLTSSFFIDIFDNDNLPNLIGLEGITTISNITIRDNNALVSLEGLDNLESVTGNFRLGNSWGSSVFQADFDCNAPFLYYQMYYEGNSALTDLSALSNLSSIGGNFDIIGNEGLVSLTGLESLNTIGNNFTFIKNNNITDFTGLNNLAAINGNCTIGRIVTELAEDNLWQCLPPVYDYLNEGNNGLTSFTGLSSLNTIGGNLVVGDNTALTGLSGLDNLQSIGGDFNFYQNNSISNLAGLDGLVFLDGSLDLSYYFNIYDNAIPGYYRGNNSLTDLTGLENLNTINGYIRIRNNDVLYDLNALDSLEHNGITTLELVENPNLAVCDAVSICNYVDSGDFSEIDSNAFGCNSVVEIENACSIFDVSCSYIADSVSISPDTIYLTEGVDATASIDFMNESSVGLDYAFLWIEFDENAVINIPDTTVTGGLSSPFPFPFTWDADIVYETSPIPPNTVVNARVNVWKGSIIDTPPFDGCEIPIVFVINSDITSTSPLNNPNADIRVFPNPLTDQSIIELMNPTSTTFQVKAYDILGKIIFHSDVINGNKYTLERTEFNSAGVYFIVVQYDKGKIEVLKLMVK